MREANRDEVATPAKPFQFGLNKLFILALLVGLALSLPQPGRGMLVIFFIAVGSLAGTVVGPRTVYGSSISGGVGGAIGFWLAAPLSLPWASRGIGMQGYFGDLELLLFGSVCFVVTGFIAGSSVGAAVGLSRQCRQEARDAAATMKRRRDREDE